MGLPVTIIGLGADGPAALSDEARGTIAGANFLAGGTRHLELIGAIGAETFPITNNLGELVERLRRRGPRERCVVLASGDPLFFGIGHLLGEQLGREQIEVRPALSSLQLAFARAGLSWHDATIASVHGRDLVRTLLPLLGRLKIGLFTRDGQSPQAIASFFIERGLKDYDAWVGEDLGTASERVTHAPLADLVGRSFSDLNVMILLRQSVSEPTAGSSGPPEVPTRPQLAGIPDRRFAQPDEGPILLTHADVRAVTLARFHDLPEGPLWDIGAGLGGVSIELARAFPDRDVVAIERSPEQLSYLRTNRHRFAAYNLRIVPGIAPAPLVSEPPPAGVFLGGSGGLLDPILDLIVSRLLPGGVLVANFVGLEHLARCLDRLRSAGWPADVTQIQVSPSRPLAGLTTFVPLRPVWIVRGKRSIGVE